MGWNHNMKIYRDIFDLCEWEQVTPEQAQAYGYGSYFAAVGMAENGEDLFGEVPEFFLHRGDITLDEPVLLEPQGNGIFILDGNLIGAHTFCFYCFDSYTFLLVNGHLAVKNYLQYGDGNLGVRDALNVDGTLILNLTDTGFVVTQGPAKAGHHVLFGSTDLCKFAEITDLEKTKAVASDLGGALEIDDRDKQKFLTEFLSREFTEVFADLMARGFVPQSQA